MTKLESSAQMSEYIYLLSDLELPMASPQITNLLNTFHLDSDPNEDDKINSQEVVDYCETRFRVILQSIMASTPDHQTWMMKILFKELVLLIFDIV